MSESKNQHFIPVWQQKLWSSDNKYVHIVYRGNKSKITAFSAKIEKNFAHDYIYSIRDKDGKNDDSLEKQYYTPLDTEANILSNEIISILDNENTPDMNEGARQLFWQFHFYDAFKRHPDAFTKYLENTDFDGSSLETKNKAVQIARKMQNDNILAAFGKRGIIFAVAPHGTSFVLPDRSFDIKSQLGAMKPRELWIPIHPKYAVLQYGNDGEYHKIFFTKDKVRKLNEYWYGIADKVISTSKRQLISLVKNHDRQKLVFKN